MAGLGGWFSKRITDKMAEVVDMFFRTKHDENYKNQLGDITQVPQIGDVAVDPSHAVKDEVRLLIAGQGFREGTSVLVGEQEMVVADFCSPVLLKVTVKRPPDARGTDKHKIRVLSPSPHEALSQPLEFTMPKA
jgi:hypothetical protein